MGQHFSFEDGVQDLGDGTTDGNSAEAGPKFDVFPFSFVYHSYSNGGPGAGNVGFAF
jgi:hypothetical protein